MLQQTFFLLIIERIVSSLLPLFSLSFSSFSLSFSLFFFFFFFFFGGGGGGARRERPRLNPRLLYY